MTAKMSWDFKHVLIPYDTTTYALNIGQGEVPGVKLTDESCAQCFAGLKVFLMQYVLMGLEGAFLEC